MQWEKDNLFNKVLGKLDIHTQKIKPDPYCMLYIKINSKWIKDLNFKTRYCKSIRKKYGEGDKSMRLEDLIRHFSNEFIPKTNRYSISLIIREIQIKP